MRPSAHEIAVEVARILFDGQCKRLYTAKEAAKYLGCGAPMIHELVAMNRLVPVRLGKSSKRWFDVQDLNQLIVEGKLANNERDIAEEGLKRMAHRA